MNTLFSQQSSVGAAQNMRMVEDGSDADVDFDRILRKPSSISHIGPLSHKISAGAVHELHPQDQRLRMKKTVMLFLFPTEVYEHL